MQAVACDQPVYGYDAGIVRKFGTQRQNQERAGTQHHTNGEFHRHRQRIAHPVIDSGQNRAADNDPEWVQRLILFRFERDTENRVLDVTNGKEVQRRRHLAVQYEEDNRLQHQNKGDDHFTASRAVHGKRFFTEDNDDAKSDYAQHHTCDILVVQQPGGDRNQNDNTHDGQQQITEVDRFKVGFGTVAFHPALAESKVNDGYQHTDDAKRKRGAPAITRRQPRRRQHREEGADVDGHIIHRKCAVETRIVLRVTGRQQGRRVSFKQTVTHSDSRHAHIDDASVMTRPCDQRITDSQHHGTQHNNAFGAQNFIT